MSYFGVFWRILPYVDDSPLDTVAEDQACDDALRIISLQFEAGCFGWLLYRWPIFYSELWLPAEGSVPPSPSPQSKGKCK